MYLGAMTKQEERGFVLWEGLATVRQGTFDTTLRTVVRFDLAKSGTTTFEIADAENWFYRGRHSDFDELPSVFFKMPKVDAEVEAFLTDTRLTGDGHAKAVFTPRFSQMWQTTQQDIRSVHSGIINLPHYVFVGPGGKNVLELAWKDWKATIGPIPTTLQFRESVQCPEYRFTHHLRLTRADGESFSSEEAIKELDMLSRFLSFCRGKWVSTALTTALDENGSLALAEWGTGKISPASDANNWLDIFGGGQMSELYSSFRDKMGDETLRGMVDILLYWYVRGDTNLVGPDGALILLQTALERASWHVLVIERKALSPDGFVRISAADQLRLLLNTLSIPQAIPADLEGLSSFVKDSPKDGPQALTLIRNRLVHPVKNPSKVQTYPYYQAYLLAKWYLELILLRLFDFSGKYSNCTKKNRWRGQVEHVPWSTPPRL